MESDLTKFHEEILELYKEVLNNKEVKFTDNFFQVGGDSMKAITLMEKINEKYKTKISLTDVLTFITGLELNVYDMASKLYEQINDKNNKESLPLKHRSEEISNIPLSFVQQGMWIEEIMNGVELEDNTQRYNVVGHAKIKVDNFNLSDFENALCDLIEETIALRIYFKVEEFNPRIAIHNFKRDEFHIKIEEYPNLEFNEMIEYMEKAEQTYKYEFDKYPLFHFRLGRDKDGNLIFLLAIHHLIADAYSVLQLLLQKVEDLYFKTNKESITNKTDIDYIDYILWQRESYEKGYFNKDIQYWKEKLSGDIPILNLSNKETIDWQTCNSCSQLIDVPDSVIEKLKDICSEEMVTTYSGFVLSMYIFLYYMFDETDLAVGGTNGGRIHEEFQSIIGNFASIQLLRTKIDPKKSYRELLKDVKETINGSYLHSPLPCGMMMREVGLEQEYFYIPYKILVNYVDSDIKERELFGRFNFSTNALVDFGLSILQPSGKYEISFLYKENLFEAEEVKEFADIMTNILKEIVKDPQIPIEEYKTIIDKKMYT